MFNPRDLDKVLKDDNPTYERFVNSSLHDLVALLNKGNFTPEQVAAEMRKISGTKWKKYVLTRAYLIREIVADVLRAHLVGFKTQSLTALGGGGIKHDAVWESDSGDLNDLAYMFVRENVRWDAPSAAARPYLNPDYQNPGHHFGMGNVVTSPGSAGKQSDTHAAGGAWAPAVARFAGPGSISYTCKQVYQYSKDNRATWQDIPGSTYEIKRELSLQRPKIKMSITKYSVLPSTTNERIANSVLV